MLVRIVTIAAVMVLTAIPAVASATTYSNMITFAVPVTVENWEPKISLSIVCDVGAAKSDNSFGTGSARVPIVYSAGAGSFNGTVSVQVFVKKPLAAFKSGMIYTCKGVPLQLVTEQSEVANVHMAPSSRTLISDTL